MSIKNKTQNTVDAIKLLCSESMFDLINSWHKWLQIERNTSDNTCYNYLQDMKAFMAFYLDYKGAALQPNTLIDLTPSDFRAFLTLRIKTGITPRSNARIISTLRNFFKFTAKRYGINNTNINLVKTPNLKTTLPRPLNQDCALDLITIENYSSTEAWSTMRDMTLFLLLYGCGLRISEALSLNVKDIHNTDQLLITGKRNKQRMVPLIPILNEYLKNYLTQKPHSLDPEDPLFIGTRGERLNPGVAQRSMRKLRSTLGLADNITPHSLRHSFATHLLTSGADLRSIQELLGHASLTSTQKYTEIDITNLQSNYKNFHPRG